MTRNQTCYCPKLLTESPLLDLNQATKCFPVKCSRVTLERWIRHGVRGIRLETIVIGNRRFTSESAIMRFIANQQSTEPEKTVSLPIRNSMSKKQLADGNHRHGLEAPQEPNRN